MGTQNVAGYLQEAVHLTDRLTVTPGVRAEWLRSTVHGFTIDDGNIPYDARAQTFTFGSLGVEYAMEAPLTLYGNITQAYRPITYDGRVCAAHHQSNRTYRRLRTVLDVGPHAQLHFGVDNILNAYYFTFRASEYPGPGIIPANGRTAYLGATIRL